MINVMPRVKARCIGIQFKINKTDRWTEPDLFSLILCSTPCMDINFSYSLFTRSGNSIIMSAMFS